MALTEAFELGARKFSVRNPGRPLTDGELARFESELGVALPSQLRSFYLRWNGGLPYPLDVPEFASLQVVVKWPDNCDAARGGRVISLGKMQRFDDELEGFMQNWEWCRNHVPSDLLPFQRDPGNSQILIGTGPANLGQIFYWPRGYGPDREAGEVPNYDNIAFVAPSFLEFLALYREEPHPGESEEDWIRRHYGDI